MFKKILIANRGEIAVRVIRACHDLNIESVAVYSEADRASLHVRLSDEAYPIGPPPSGESYLRIDRILEAAKTSHVDAIHPGYGFLAENPAFVRACEDTGIAFIGPPSGPMKRLGNKLEARRLAKEEGLPVVPGTLDPVATPEEALAIAGDIGYPVMLKSASGGGGRGMRLVMGTKEMGPALRGARAESLTAFGDDTIYIEKAIPAPRHIEFQILCDRYGKGVHLYDRECSVQRRHQKLIEESPAPGVDQKTRKRIGGLALQTALTAGYVNAGTMEFIMDQDRNLYFLEMNTRLQVEHPVTELVTGIDLVRAQIEIASGKAIPWSQDDIVQRGAALECRVCAEDPLNNFLPSPGKIVSLRPPGGGWIREDTGIYQGWEVPEFYDSLLSKLIAWGRTREEAIQRMKRALDEYWIVGVPTNIPFHRFALDTKEFRDGGYTTAFIGSVFTPSSLAGQDGEGKIPAMLAAFFAFLRDQEKRKTMVMKPSGETGSRWTTAGRREAADRWPRR